MQQDMEPAKTWRDSFLAYGFFLTLLIGASLLAQTFGNLLDISVSRASLWAAFLPCLWLTYRIYFPFSRRHIAAFLLLTFLLALIGILSRALPDMSWDGINYQQPAVWDIMLGWNPLRGGAYLLWENIYPSGAWAVEAAIAYVYGSVEDARALQTWWLLIALIVWTYGLQSHLLRHTGQAKLSIYTLWGSALMAASTIVLCQLLTHYVDALMYTAGLCFLGALLFYNESARMRYVSCILMAICIPFIVNTKLTGIYHAVILCALAVVFLWHETKRFPLSVIVLLAISGLFAVLVVGYRPYVTNILTYGSLLHTNSESFSATQRPYNLASFSAPMRFLYSLFSITGGSFNYEASVLKFPWVIHASEWKNAGLPDARSGGFGPLFALGLVCAITYFAFNAKKIKASDKGLLIIAFFCFASSILFPEGWWARYVPFAYAVPFLLLFALPAPQKQVARLAQTVILLIFTANASLTFYATYRYQYEAHSNFLKTVSRLKNAAPGSVYITPAWDDYLTASHGYRTVIRRLAEHGIAVNSIHPAGTCICSYDQVGGVSICHE